MCIFFVVHCSRTSLTLNVCTLFLYDRGQFVHLAPGALEGSNAERTLQELDALATQRRQPLQQSTRPPAAAKYSSVLSAAGSLLDDIS